MILCSAEPRIISCLPTHVINLVINDNSLEILYIYIYIYLYIKSINNAESMSSYSMIKYCFHNQGVNFEDVFQLLYSL